MRNRLRNIGVAILFALLVIFIIVWFTYISFLLRSDQQLANAYVAVSTLILALATVLLAGFTGLSIRSGEKREKRDRKERLLNKIIEWVFELSNISLEPLTEDNIVFREYNISLKYGITLSKVEYFEKVILKVFKDEVLKRSLLGFRKWLLL